MEFAVRRYSRAQVIAAAKAIQPIALRDVDGGSYTVTGAEADPLTLDFVTVSWGPYTEYGPAQERAMKAQGEGVRGLRIDRGPEGWTVKGVQTK